MGTRILRLASVIDRTGLSRSSVYAAIKANSFPSPRRLSSRTVGWHESEIEDWINSRAASETSRGGKS